MNRQTLRDWVHRYNAEGTAGLCNLPAPGRRPKLLTEGHMGTSKAVVLAGPDPQPPIQEERDFVVIDRARNQLVFLGVGDRSRQYSTSCRHSSYQTKV
jgi:hypothetical protein